MLRDLNSAVPPGARLVLCLIRERVPGSKDLVGPCLQSAPSGPVSRPSRCWYFTLQARLACGWALGADDINSSAEPPAKCQLSTSGGTRLGDLKESPLQGQLRCIQFPKGQERDGWLSCSPCHHHKYFHPTHLPVTKWRSFGPVGGHPLLP